MIQPSRRTVSGPEPQEKPDLDLNLQKNRIMFQPSRRTVSGPDPPEKADPDPNLQKGGLWPNPPEEPDPKPTLEKKHTDTYKTWKMVSQLTFFPLKSIVSEKEILYPTYKIHK